MKRCQTSRSGAVLVAVVISLIAAGLIGATILSLATSARNERVTFGITNRAYYLAESGAAYVRARSAQEFAYPPFEGHPPITNTMPNGDVFIVTAQRTNVVLISVDPSGATNRTATLHTIATSVGIANPDTALEARQQIFFDMLVSGMSLHDWLNEHDADFSVFTGSTDKPDYNESMFEESGTGQIFVKNTGPSKGIAINPTLTSRSHEGLLALSWQNKTNIHDALLYLYKARDALLSYDLQIKLGYFPNVPSSHFMMGLSFRLDEISKASYGLSFFHSITNSDAGYLNRNAEWVLQLDSNFAALRSTNYYLVLWYRSAAGAPIQLINSRRLPPEFLTADASEMNYYNTLLLRLKEVYTDASRTSRKNEIAAYLASSLQYPVWPNYFPSNAVWQEDLVVFPAGSLAPVVWDQSPYAPATGNQITNVDSRATSVNFATRQNAEIGIHLFYDRTSANETFFRDFAIRFESLGVPYGGGQIQW